MLGLALALALAATGAACGGGSDDGAGAGPGAGPDRPNVLFVLTDDMVVDDLAAMPHVRSWLGDAGTSFSRAYVSVSLCCPSRVTMLRGQYAHNTGVQSNEGTNGGFPVAHALGVESSTVATWLDAAGYRTALLGKYLNHYPRGAGATYVPPGWDTWSSPVDGSTEVGYDYTLNEDGRLVRYGDAPEDYAGHVLVQQAAEVAADADAAGEPFFTWLSVDAPHEPATPGPGDEDAFADATAPRDGTFDEVDPSAPAWVAGLPPLTEAQQAEIDERYRSRLASLRSLDRELDGLFRGLDESGQLDDTYVVFTSDNGFHLGQHRLKAGKQSAYEEDIRVPLLVRGPGVAAGETSDALVGNVDLAPTFAALAGADAPDFVDGRDLSGLWLGDAEGSGRAALLLEHWPPFAPGYVPPTAPSGTGAAPGTTTSTTLPDDVDIAPLIGDTDGHESPSEGPTPPQFSGVRTDRYTYVAYVTGEVELYDGVDDPEQRHNLASTADPALLDRLARLTEQLAACAGATCRSLEGTDVP